MDIYNEFKNMREKPKGYFLCATSCTAILKRKLEWFVIYGLFNVFATSLGIILLLCVCFNEYKFM